MMSASTFHILSWGGLGDAILATPCFRAFKRQRPGDRLVVHPKNQAHYELYLHNPYIDELWRPSPLNRMRRALLTRVQRTPVHEPAYGMLLPSLFYQRRAPHIIAEMLGLELDNDTLEVFLTEEEEAAAKRILHGLSTPVAIHITSNYSSNQHWPLEHWAELVRRNPRYTFVQLGLPSEPAVPGTVDLRCNLPLRVSIAVLKYAVSFVGVVSFFAHATNAVRTPGVVFYGPSAVAVWGHPGNRNLDLRLPCAPCADILGSQPCPYGSPCMSGISVVDVERALEAQIAARLERESPNSRPQLLVAK